MELYFTLMEELFSWFFTKLSVLLTASGDFPTRAALYLHDLELLILKSAFLAGIIY